MKEGPGKDVKKGGWEKDRRKLSQGMILQGQL